MEYTGEETNMKLLFENWRKFLKEDAHPKIQRILDDLINSDKGIAISVVGNQVEFYYIDVDTKERSGGDGMAPTWREGSTQIRGRVEIKLNKDL